MGYSDAEITKIAWQFKGKRDEPFDYRERAAKELFLDPEGAAFEKEGTVVFGNNAISALKTPADYQTEFTLGKQNVAWRA